MLSTMQYPHWIMVTGAVLVVLGFIGFIFHKNKNPQQAQPTAASLEAEIKAKEK
jgi:hypothetical protein